MYNDSLATLHCVKLNEMARRGISLKRRGRGVTVLLEKVVSERYVNKLHVIYLFQGDFNY